MTQDDLANPTRRQLIATAGAAGAVAGIDALVGAVQAQPGKAPHVVIVGAGLAGLCAAYKLQKKGWSYTLLEAEQYHVGGRVRTMTMQPSRSAGPVHWEAGAMRIPKHHDLVHGYIREFGLETRPFVMFNPKTLLFARGHRTTNEKEEELKRCCFRLKPGELAKSSTDLWNLAVADAVKLIDADGRGLSEADRKDLRSADAFTSPRLIELDRTSLRQLFQAARLSSEPLSDEAIDFAMFGSGNLTIQHGAATEFLREELTEVWVPGFREIIGGNSKLPLAFLARLQRKPEMGREVIRIEQDKLRGRVRAVYRTGNRTGQAEGDFLLCTIPFPLLAHVEVDPPFSHEKQRAIIELGYDSGTKVALMTKYRFWEKHDGIFGGSSTTDLMSGAIIYPSDNAPDETTGKKSDPKITDRPGVFLACYTWGQDARRLGAMPASQREEFVIQQVSQVHPELKQDDMIIGRASWAWDTYRWCGGAFALYQPGQFARMHRHVIQPEDRVYFAGEHCSHSHSWMQGALESAERAVDTLAARAG